MLKTDYKAGDVVTIVSLPRHIENLTLIGKQGVVNLNDLAKQKHLYRYL